MCFTRHVDRQIFFSNVLEDLTVVFTEVDLHSMIKLFPNIGIKRHKMPVTDWLYITRYVRIYHLHINMTCGTHQFNPFDWCLRAYICKLNSTYVILSSTHNSIEQDDVLFVLLANHRIINCDAPICKVKNVFSAESRPMKSTIKCTNLRSHKFLQERQKIYTHFEQSDNRNL